MAQLDFTRPIKMQCANDIKMAERCYQILQQMAQEQQKVLKDCIVNLSSLHVVYYHPEAINLDELNYDEWWNYTDKTQYIDAEVFLADYDRPLSAHGDELTALLLEDIPCLE